MNVLGLSFYYHDSSAALVKDGVLVAAAFLLLANRDLGAGFFKQRPGPAEGNERLASPLALAIRLQRTSLIGWVLGAAFKPRKQKFHGAGREDVNVRMLGQGRSFVVELVNPRHLDVDVAACEAEINRRNEGRIEVLGLQTSSVMIRRSESAHQSIRAVAEVDALERAVAIVEATDRPQSSSVAACLQKPSARVAPVTSHTQALAQNLRRAFSRGEARTLERKAQKPVC